MYKDKEKQRQANKEAKARWKAKQVEGIPDQGILAEGIPVTFLDACGNEHRIDYENRRDRRKQLVDWINNGTPEQAATGRIAIVYDVIQWGIDNIEARLQCYLGLDLSLAAMTKQGCWSDCWKVKR